jgi:hypothetical protein
MKYNFMRNTCLILFLCVATLLAACASNSNTNVPVAANLDSEPIHTPPPWRQDLTPKDIERIKWLEGTWKGTTEGKEPFYEKYRFEDTTMYEDSYEDSSLQKVTESAKYALINGEFRHTQDGKRVVVSELTDDKVVFIPVAGQSNSYTFEKQPGGKWRATVEWPATEGQPPKKTIYNMEPYKK